MALAAIRARIIQIISDQPLQLTPEKAVRMTDEYMFMQLKAEQPTAELAPSYAVDQVWHNHIVDTRSYQQLQTVLMPNGGFIHHNPVLSEQPNYEMRYANTLSLLTKKSGELDTASWPIDNHEYKKLNIMVVSAEDSKIATAGPQVYCHKRQTVLQLVESIKLVMGHTAAERLIITGMMNTEDVPKSTQQVRQTEMWRSSIIRVTRFASDANGKQSDTSIIRSNDRLRFLRFRNDAQIEVSSLTICIRLCFLHYIAATATV
jgi:hypothetical protein